MRNHDYNYISTAFWSFIGFNLNLRVETFFWSVFLLKVFIILFLWNNHVLSCFGLFYNWGLSVSIFLELSFPNSQTFLTSCQKNIFVQFSEKILIFPRSTLLQYLFFLMNLNAKLWDGKRGLWDGKSLWKPLKINYF